MKILSIGHAAYDITIPLDEFPIENTKNRVNELVECGGGPASQGAYLLGKWGMDTYFAGTVGNDLYGSVIENELLSVGVNTKYLQKLDDVKTTSSYIIANKGKGTRTILTYRTNNMKMDDVELDFEPDVILLDGQEYEMTKKILEKYPNAISIIDAGRPRKEIIELAKMCTYVACGHEFAEEIAGTKLVYDDPKTLVEVMSKIKTVFDGHVLVTLESTGTIYEIDGVIKLMPSISVTAVDSTGAGDIFHGGFTYAIANNYSYEDAIRIGNVAGALSVTKVGGRNSVPSKEEMKRVLNDFR